MAKRQTHSASGFTLIELLITTAIGVIGMATILVAATQGMRAMQYAQLGGLAKVAAARQMEYLRNQSFSTINTMSALAQPLPFQDTNGDGIGDGLEILPTGATGRVFVQTYNGNPDLKQITVTVSLDAARAWRLVTVMARTS